MTETKAPPVGGGTTQQGRRETQAGRGGPNLVSEHGRTTIAGEAVAKIAGMAAREISGVHDFGSGPARAFGAIKGKLGGEETVTRGIAVEVGERQAAVDIDVIVDYGVAIPDVAESVRRNVIDAVEHMCGLEVTEVNIAVDDVALPKQEEPAGAEGESRVR